MPPPCYVCKIQHSPQVSRYFFAVLFGLAGVSAPAVSADFLEALFFNLALIAFLFLELPNEPIAIFPFLDFLSPLPMFKKVYACNNNEGNTDSQVPHIIILTAAACWSQARPPRCHLRIAHGANECALILVADI